VFTTPPFAWDDLARYKAGKRFLDGVSADYRTLWSPTDDVHGMLVALLTSARHSVVLSMYALTDTEMGGLLGSKLRDPSIYVQISLDSSQALGTTEAKVLASLRHDDLGNSIAIGQSAKHAISHVKVMIVDGLYTISGSTNWTMSGEQRQLNQILLSRDPVMAAEYRAVLDVDHDRMLAAQKKAHPLTTP
jgi:phosphatidylserine/phosphatidylglycerophosphate/cardiolipin synthase-like enzyme